MNIDSFLKSVIDCDPAEIVICNTQHIVVYMNPAAVRKYSTDLTGKSIKDCHSQDSIDRINKVVKWFSLSTENNTMHTYYSEKENKDVYMVALRNGVGELIGYYEKHEWRNRDNKGFYQM